ncbi:sugar phosphate isomerase/epimerase family protein [Pseudonocardia sp. H11422]|uniref:sugar phosphate isomerase/epimerase family protein n=1 Tax=Pseudonocardia sp. H11422 TaxID=2835866 RepID=UPI001BDC25D5|nr:sugar phosphate isomerase/epimerase [Pseudonocardia sp. H11422]
MGSSTDGVFPASSDGTGGSPPLVVSSYTLGTEVAFEERARAAAEAGFDGIGLRAENYRDAHAAGLDDAAMRRIADRHGIGILEVEYVTAWGTPQDRDTTQQEKEQTVFRMARAFGVRHLNAGLLEQLPLDVMTKAFADLCDRAGQDLTVALEFMPYSGVPDLATAWQILQGADRRNGGLIVDAWHWARAGTTPDDLGPVPADAIVTIQLCDVREHPMEPLRAESLGHRLPPGRGHGDTVGLVRALRDKGVRPRVVAVEVISDDLVSRGIDVAARTNADATREVLRSCLTGAGQL